MAPARSFFSSSSNAYAALSGTSATSANTREQLAFAGRGLLGFAVTVLVWSIFVGDWSATSRDASLSTTQLGPTHALVPDAGGSAVGAPVWPGWSGVRDVIVLCVHHLTYARNKKTDQRHPSAATPSRPRASTTKARAPHGPTPSATQTPPPSTPTASPPNGSSTYTAIITHRTSALPTSHLPARPSSDTSGSRVPKAPRHPPTETP